MHIYPYDFLKKLSFLRFGGTKAEQKAAEYILKEMEKLLKCCYYDTEVDF